MSRTPFKEAAAVVVFLIVATLAIAMSGADQAISSRFFINGKWPVGEQLIWKALYRIDRIPSISFGIFGFALFIASYFRNDFKQWRRSGFFLVLLLILGPGLLVNSVFKEHWGRPRPREIAQFGGQKEFLQPWQKGISGKGRSFPSGHASAAFYMSSPYFIYRRRRRVLAYYWLAGGTFFGIIMGIARITQGGHFLSDNLWAWGMVYLCALALATVLKLDPGPEKSSGTNNASCST